MVRENNITLSKIRLVMLKQFTLPHSEMNRATPPVAFFILTLPFGLGSGLCELWLPYALTRAGFPIAMTGSIVAIGISANLYRFVYAPVIDLTLTLRTWYLVGVVSCAMTTLLLGTMSLAKSHALVVTVLVFLCEVSTTLVMNPVGALMATTVSEDMKGRAAGWCQAANKGGAAIAAGVGIWVSAHFSNILTAILLAAMMVGCAAGLLLVAGGVSRLAHSWAVRFRDIRTGLVELGRDPESRLIVVMIMSPIGVGAASAIWPAVAIEWGTSADRVALDTGLLAAVVATAGAVLGGQVADHLGRWWSYFGAGVLLATVGIAAAVLDRSPLNYDLGVLGYQLFIGMGTAAWCALCLRATGRTGVATKYAVLGSLGNLPNTYMTALDGWVHDRSGVATMLVAEAAVALACVALGLIVLRRIERSRVPLSAIAQPTDIGESLSP